MSQCIIWKAACSCTHWQSSVAWSCRISCQAGFRWNLLSHFSLWEMRGAKWDTLGPTKASDRRIFDTCMLGEKHVRTCRRAFLAIKTLWREYPDWECKRIPVFNLNVCPPPPKKVPPAECSLMYTLNYIPASTQYDAWGGKKKSGLGCQGGRKQRGKREWCVCSPLVRLRDKAVHLGTNSFFPPLQSHRSTLVTIPTSSVQAWMRLAKLNMTKGGNLAVYCSFYANSADGQWSRKPWPVLLVVKMADMYRCLMQESRTFITFFFFFFLSLLISF